MSPERIVLLVRHASHAEVGRVLSGRSSIPLDTAGRSEAAALALALENVPLAAVIASPRERAQETAAAIVAGRSVTIETDEALDEIDFGGFTGRSFAALAGDPDWRRWNADRGAARCPEGETMAEATARAWKAVERLPEGRSLCVTHCDIIRGMVCDVLGLPYARMFQLGCDPASVTELVFEGDTVAVAGLNRRAPQAVA